MIMTVEHKLALTGTSWVGMSFSAPGTLPATPVLATAAAPLSVGQSSLCLLLPDNPSYRESRQTTLWCGSWTNGGKERLSN